MSSDRPVVRELFGRQAELGRILAMVEAGTRTGAALVVEGPAGVGKTAVLAAAIEAAERDDFRILRCTGTPVESRLRYAGLHELLYPVMDAVDLLPGPQRSAIRAAFGAELPAGSADNATSLAVLGLVRRLSEHRPVFIAIDDMHRLDAQTVGTLLFLARRLGDAPVVLVMCRRTWRDQPSPDHALPRMPLTALDRQASAGLLDHHRPRLRGRTRERVMAEAAGIPLALLELSPALSCRPPLTERLRRAFHEDTEPLPAATRMLLLIAAADELAGNEWDAAARLLDLTMDDLAPAEEAGVIDLDHGRARFAHPLIGTAVYDSAALADRLAVHRALADVLVADPRRAVVHRAAGTIAPDESVAADLEEMAGSTAGALARAAELSPRPEDRARRLALAADAARRAGERTEVRRLATGSREITEDPAVLGTLAMTEADDRRVVAEPTARAPLTLIRLAQETAGRDVESAGLMLACAATEFALEVPPPALAEELEKAFGALNLPAGHPLRVSVLGLMAPHRYAAELTPALGPRSVFPGPGQLAMAGLVADRLHHLPAGLRYWAEAVRVAREADDTSDLGMALCGLAKLHLATGRLSAAAESADELAALATEPNRVIETMASRVLWAEIHAWGGRTAEAAEALAAGRAAFLPAFPAVALAGLAKTTGVVALVHGRAEQAYEAFLEVVTPGSPRHHPTIAEQVIAEFAEAAMVAGKTAEAEPVVERLAETTLSFGSPMLRLRTFRAQAMIAGESQRAGEAEAAFRRSIAESDGEHLRFEEARTRLWYGRWLRKTGRPHEARTHLLLALEVFATLEAGFWRQRAEVELRAAGGPARWPAQPPAPAGRTGLTPREQEIVELAGAGLTNREIAERLLLSPRTVDVHLYHAYPKLGIRDRNQVRFPLAAPRTVAPVTGP